jgi:type IV pilus assembly protein PilW
MGRLARQRRIYGTDLQNDDTHMKKMTLSRSRFAGHGRAATRSDVSGLTLVELMISMMLGLLVVGSASAIFISNRQTYRATEGLGRVQENGRMAFELMGRDLREAGGSSCGNGERKRNDPLKLVNLINGSTTRWWTNWNNGITGYEGAIPLGSPANRVATADAIDLMAGDSSSAATISQHNTASAQFQINTTDHGFSSSDLAIACDWKGASLFQISSAASGSNIIQHQVSGSPGNCSIGLGYVIPASACAGPVRTKQYGPNVKDPVQSATIIRIQPVRWYVGTSAGGRSLFRSAVVNNGGVLTVTDQEIAEGVNDMQLQYLLVGAAAYVDASAVTAANRWNDVIAVRVTLDMLSADRAGVGGAQLARRIVNTVTLRNRME